MHVAGILAYLYPLNPTRDAVTFRDVSIKHANYTAIKKLQMAGVIHGSDGLFCPEEILTRGQMAKILVVASDFKISQGTKFKDVASNYWSYDYITKLAYLKVVGGDHGLYKPNSPVTCGQFVAMLSSVFRN